MRLLHPGGILAIRTQPRDVRHAFAVEVKNITYEGEKVNPHTVSQRSSTLRYRWIPASLHLKESSSDEVRAVVWTLRSDGR